MTTIVVDGTKGGRVFDGVGAVSGGGGNSVQLIGYPAQQRSDILDYLFKPGAGAALHILKVEIGGDANSSAGAEPSHEHSRGVVNSNGGYEWWLMEAAKARNPAIKLCALPWAAPGWIGGGHFWCQDMIGYLVGWLGVAAQHGLTIDYIGGWNEQPACDTGWFKNLRAALDSAGYNSTAIVAADQAPWSKGSYDPSAAWAMADHVASDPDLAAAVGVLGAHDVCSFPTTGMQCWSTAPAVATGKPLWHSEVGAMPGDDGSQMIRSVMRGYIDAKMTGHIHWPLITTQPPGLRFLDRGLIWAAQPRSGHYIVKAMTAAIAMVTQFTQPGWVHIDSACGYLGGHRGNGSYLALRAANLSAWSLITETTTATTTQNITVTIKGGLPHSIVHVWRTHPASSNRADWLLRRNDLTLDASGSFTFGCYAGCIYTFTSTTGQGMASHAIPANQPFRLPYSDNWNRGTTAAGTMPPYLAPQDGSFEFAPAGDGSGSLAVQQTTPQQPIFWNNPSSHRFPYAVIGDNSMTGYKVSAKVLFTNRVGSAGLIARFSQQGKQVYNFRGYILDFGSAGGWWLTKNSNSEGNTVLAHGTVAAPVTGNWTSLALQVKGTAIDAWVGGQHVATVTDNDPNYAAGPAGIETDSFRGTWSPAQFRDFAITAA